MCKICHCIKIFPLLKIVGGHAVAYWLGHYAGTSRVRDPMRGMNIFNFPNPSDSIRPWCLLSLNKNECQKQIYNVSGIKARPVRTADNLAAISDSIV
jgi:hypothetical protein